MKGQRIKILIALLFLFVPQFLGCTEEETTKCEYDQIVLNIEYPKKGIDSIILRDTLENEENFTIWHSFSTASFYFLFNGARLPKYQLYAFNCSIFNGEDYYTGINCVIRYASPNRTIARVKSIEDFEEMIAPYWEIDKVIIDTYISSLCDYLNNTFNVSNPVIQLRYNRHYDIKH